MEESQETHEKSLEESQEISKEGAVEEIPIPSVRLEPVQLEKIAEGSQNGPVALVETRQETHETFQQGFLEEIQTHRGIAGCLIGGLALVALVALLAIFGVDRGTSNITPLGTDQAPSSSQNGPVALVEIRQETNEMFFLESASSADNETPSFLSQILEWISFVVFVVLSIISINMVI